MKEKRKKEPALEITGLIDSPRWKHIRCCCSQDVRDVLHRYPIQNCINCKFTIAENSIPSKPFTVNGKLITKIKIVRGKKYEDIIGWEF